MMNQNDDAYKFLYSIYSIWIGIFVVTALFTILLLVYVYYRPSHKKKSLPRMNCSPLLIYILIYASCLRRAGTADKFLYVLLEIAAGLCVLFDKQRLFNLYIFNKSLVILYKPETVEVVLNSAVNIDKSKEYDFLKPWLGTGLLTSAGKKWQSRRKLLTPAFHFQILKDFMPIFNEQSIILVSKLQKLQHDSWSDIVPFITSCTLDVICETAMGVSIKAQSDGCHDYVQAIKEICNTFFDRVLKPWLYVDFIFYRCTSGRNFKRNLNTVHSFTRKVIRDKKEEILKEELVKNEKPNENTTKDVKKRKAFLELLVEHHLKDPSFTEEDIREEVDTFMFEGHDTTSMSLCWTLYCVGLEEKVQFLIHEELDNIFKGDTKRYITREDLAEMKYLECVIKESLRLYPSVPFIARNVVQSFDVLGYTVEPGNVAFIFPWMLHRDPDSFPNPERFDPERFFPENITKRHPYAYVPFSAGARNCIGQKFALLEEKTILANIFRNFKVVSKNPRDKMNVKTNLVIRNYEPMEMRFIPRTKK